MSAGTPILFLILIGAAIVVVATAVVLIANHNARKGD